MTHHMHSLKHGIVYSNRVPGRLSPRRYDLARICARYPNRVLASVHAGVTILNACSSLYLASIGLPVGAVLALHYVQVFVLGVPMHSLTLHLSKRV